MDVDVVDMVDMVDDGCGIVCSPNSPLPLSPNSRPSPLSCQNLEY